MPNPFESILPVPAGTICLALHLEDDFAENTLEEIRRHVADMRNRIAGFPPVVIVPRGVRLEVIIDPRACQCAGVCVCE